MTHHNQTKEQTTWFLILAFSGIVIIVSSPLFGFEFLTARPLNPSLLTFSKYSQRAPSWFLLLPVVDRLLELHIKLFVKATLIIIFVDWPESVMNQNLSLIMYHWSLGLMVPGVLP
jgi:hypothetical protein